MFHSRIINNKINHLHERCLRLLYGDKSLSFEKMLEQDKSVTIHTRNLQMLWKCYGNAQSISKYISSHFPWDVSSTWYKLWFTNQFSFAMSKVRSVFHGSESISYLGPKIWDIVPLELKELISVFAFKKGIKEWKPKNCPCRYVRNMYPI